MTTDTIAIPAEIPREIRDGDKVLRVVGWEFGSLKTGDWYWCQSGQQYRKCYDSLQNTIFLKPIVEPVPRYIYPTPVEACRMIADAGGPIKCEFSDDDFKSERSIIKGLCAGVVWRQGVLQFSKFDGTPWRKIRVLQPE